MQSMNDDYRNEVVKRALDWRDSASPASRAALNNAANDSVEVDGFRKGKAGLAMTSLLIKPVAERSVIIDGLAGEVLRVWAESQASLCDLVTVHLAGESLLADAPDYSENTIGTRQHDRRWDDAIDRLTELHPDESRDDLLLASYYVSGLLPATGDADAGPPGSPGSDEFVGALGEALDFLRSLPPDSPEWEQTVVGFVDAIGEVKEARLAEVQEVADLDAEVVGISRQHASLLEYFEWDLEKRLAARPRPWADLPAARQVVKGLAGLLGEYAPVHPMAAVRSEEARRAPHRAELEERIDGVLAQFEALPVRAAPTARVEEPPVRPVVDLARPEQQPVVAPVFSEEELALLRAENERLSSENQSLVSHNQDLIAQAGELESYVNESRNLAETWRRLYQDLLKSQEPASVNALPEFENVQQVVDLAERRLAGQLSFLLNSRSDTEIPFDNPRQVWDALEWLATTYYQAKTGKNGSSDFDLSLRQTCGWRYTPDQSNTTVGQYRDYYETRVGHRRLALREHIGTGNGYHRGTIRIAFAWDADEQKVVVGYVGRHQRTDAS